MRSSNHQSLPGTTTGYHSTGPTPNRSSSGGQSPSRRSPMGVQLLHTFNDDCVLWRYRCAVAEVQELGRTLNSLYSPEFIVGGRSWRIHLQERPGDSAAGGAEKMKFLALHLQCVSPTPKHTYSHFKLTLCNVNRENSRAKAFHCEFKKGGSAWGLHQFIDRERLLRSENGFIDYGGNSQEMISEFDQYLHPHGRPPQQQQYHHSDGGNSSSAASTSPCIVIEVLLRIVHPNAEGNYDLGLPSVPRGVIPLDSTNQNSMMRGVSGGGGPSNSSMHRTSGGSPSGRGGGGHNNSMSVPQYQQQQLLTSRMPAPDAVDIALLAPSEGNTCDMTFKLSDGTNVPVHRCIIHARLAKLFDKPTEIPIDAEISFDALPVVFDPFLRYVYTEESPQRGTLKASEFIEVYLLGMKFGFFHLAESCLAHVEATVRPEAILSIACAKYDPEDEILTNFYIRIMVSGYKQIIEDPQYEQLPGALHRKLSLAVYSSTTSALPPIVFPKMLCSLSAQLANLADSGEYSDFEIAVRDGPPLKAHKCVLASRSPPYNSMLYKEVSPSNTLLPDFDSEEFQFSRRAWENFLSSLYRGCLIDRDMSAEDIAVMYKMSETLALRGSLREGAKTFISDQNALRVLIYAEKYHVMKLKTEANMIHVASTFGERIHRDQNAWELVAELPKSSLLGLFRGVVAGKR